MMKHIKLWAGILGLAAGAYIMVVSCYEACWNVLTTSGHFNGIAGIIIAILLLAGSLVRIGMRSAPDDSGSIISLVLFAIAAALAFAVGTIVTTGTVLIITTGLSLGMMRPSSPKR